MKYLLAVVALILSVQSFARTIPEDKSKPGDCVSWPMEEKTIISKINSSMQVAGKAFYMLDGIDNKIAGHDAAKLDAIATKIPCPTKENKKP